MATVAKKLKLACPCCGSADGSLTVDLNGPVSGAFANIECGECGSSFTAAKAVELAAENLRQWQKVEHWMAAMPG